MSETDKDPNEAMADEWANALEEQADQEATANGAEQAAETNAESAQFQQLQDDRAGMGDEGSDVSLDGILDIPVTISMEIGRTQINIRNLLQLNQGSVVELDRLAGEPMDVMVNGTLIAQGEVVVVNEKFGIRLTDVISPSERVKRLGK
jgi:flagellar motor switch protein FliN/FliY